MLHWLTDKQIGYIAGMIDGEGTIGISKSICKNRRITYSINMYIANTNIKVLEWIQATLIMGVICINNCQNSKHKIGYRLKFRLLEIEELLPMIVDCLIIKKEQAIRVMEFLELSNLPKGYNSRIENIKKEKAEDDYIKKQILYEEVLKLNKKGTEDYDNHVGIVKK